MKFVTIEIEGRIARAKLSRGDGRNALSHQAMIELRDTGRMLQEKPEVTAVVLYTDGGNFSAGADLGDFSNLTDSAGLLELRHQLKLGPDMCKAWEDIEAYTIVAIEGYCIGGASALAAAMDYRVLARGGHMRLPEIGLGINMSWQTIPRLVAQIGPARTKQYVTLSEMIEPEEALSWGLVEELANDGEALDRAMDFAKRIAKLPPLPVKMTKMAVNATANALAQATSYMDRDQYLLTAQTEDFKESVSAFFEKRKPKFTGN